MLFPDTDKNWVIAPTPEPRIARDTVKQIAMNLVTTDPQTNEPIIPTAEELLKPKRRRIPKEARRRGLPEKRFKMPF